MQWRWAENQLSGIGLARENVWSRAARRKKKREQEEQKASAGEPMEDDANQHVALGVKLSMTKWQVEIRWLQGKDSVLFESFCGMLRRAINQE
jgi:23S rRNA (adenine1618-N6)-methyltransferase